MSEFSHYHEDLVMVHLGKQKIKMNKPIFAGMVILDIAKTVVYDMHYNYILKKFSPERSKLLFTAVSYTHLTLPTNREV